MKNSVKFAGCKITMLAVFILWSAGLMLPVLVYFFPQTEILLPFLKMTYSHVCHQIPQKSFSFNGQTFLVCARCTGIYMGIFMTSAATLFFRQQKVYPLNKLLLLIAGLPMLLDVFFSTFGVYTYNKIIACCTGIIFGSVVFAYILNVLFEIFFNDNNKDTI